MFEHFFDYPGTQIENNILHLLLLQKLSIFLLAYSCLACALYFFILLFLIDANLM
jgi:hypothetical protein